MEICAENGGRPQKLSESEFEGLLEVFRTLLQWEAEEECDRNRGNGCNHHQQSVGRSSN